jgi:polyphosphate kinase
MNSLSDFGMIDKLYEASNAGKIQLEVRGFVR